MSYPSFQNTGESELGEINYPTVMDEIDQWLADNFGIMPGACSSIESVKYSVAKRVAKALWPKKEPEECKHRGTMTLTPTKDRDWEVKDWCFFKRTPINEECSINCPYRDREIDY